MNRFLLWLALILPLVAFGQSPLLRNSATTNNPARLPPAMATSTSPLYPVSVLNPDGSGADRVIQYSPSFFLTGTNVFLSGILSAGGGAFTNSLTLNGSPVLTNAPGSDPAAPVNNFYATNNFFISGKGNTLVITQTLTVSGQYVYPLVPGTGITFATNNIGTGQTNLTISASGSSTPTTVTTLTYTGGTNLIGFDGTTNGATFKVTLTNNAFLGGANATNFPNADTYKTYTLHVINDSAGLWTLTFDASKFAWSEGVQPVKSTNGSGYDVYYFHTHGFTNGMLVGAMNALIR